MTAEVDLANRALSAIGTRSQIASLEEVSNEARACRLLMGSLRDELTRMAPWNFALTYDNLGLLCAAPGTPENTSPPLPTWQRGIPYLPWLYEYAYPSLCLRPLWIVPQLVSNFTGVPPISMRSIPSYTSIGAVRFRVAVDQVADGVPSNGGADTKVILTNQPQAMLAYLKRVEVVDVWDAQFQQAYVAALAARLVITLTGDKNLANLKIAEANAFILNAREGDGNEGLTVIDSIPDWLVARGIWCEQPSILPSVEWGGLLGGY